MGKNILIVPSHAISRTANRVPYLNWINNASNLPLTLLVQPSGLLFNRLSPSEDLIFKIDPSNKIISVLFTLNVKDYMAFGAAPSTQVIDGTLNWVGPTTNITGAQGAQGAQGNPGVSITPTNPVTTLTLTSAQNIVYSSFGTKLFNTYSTDVTGTATFT